LVEKDNETLKSVEEMKRWRGERSKKENLCGGISFVVSGNA